MEGKLYRTLLRLAQQAPRHLHPDEIFSLAELTTVANLFGCLFQKIVDMLVGLGLKAGLCFDPVRDLNCRVHPDVLVEIPSPVQIGFNQDKFFGRDLG